MVDLRTAQKFGLEHKGHVVHRASSVAFQVTWNTPRQDKFYSELKGFVTVHIYATGKETCGPEWAEYDIHHYALSVRGPEGKSPICLTDLQK